jgi:hypothetical protein
MTKEPTSEARARTRKKSIGSASVECNNNEGAGGTDTLLLGRSRRRAVQVRQTQVRRGLAVFRAGRRQLSREDVRIGCGRCGYIIIGGVWHASLQVQSTTGGMGVEEDGVDGCKLRRIRSSARLLQSGRAFIGIPRVVAVDEMVVVERLAELAELAGVGVEIPLRIAHGGNATNSNGTAHGLSERKPGQATLVLCHLASTDEKQQ